MKVLCMSTARCLAKAELAILPDATLGAISYMLPDGRDKNPALSSGVKFYQDFSGTVVAGLDLTFAELVSALPTMQLREGKVPSAATSPDRLAIATALGPNAECRPLV